MPENFSPKEALKNKKAKEKEEKKKKRQEKTILTQQLAKGAEAGLKTEIEQGRVWQHNGDVFVDISMLLSVKAFRLVNETAIEKKLFKAFFPEGWDEVLVTPDYFHSFALPSDQADKYSLKITLTKRKGGM